MKYEQIYPVDIKVMHTEASKQTVYTVSFYRLSVFVRNMTTGAVKQSRFCNPSITAAIRCVEKIVDPGAPNRRLTAALTKLDARIANTHKDLAGVLGVKSS